MGLLHFFKFILNLIVCLNHVPPFHFLSSIDPPAASIFNHILPVAVGLMYQLAIWKYRVPWLSFLP